MSDFPHPHEIKPLPYRRKDAGDAYNYTLTRSYVGTFKGRLAPRIFTNKWGEILPLSFSNQTQITMATGYAWDGATGVPDVGGWKMALATIFHDFIYQFAKDIAAAWGWTVPEVLDFADDIFHEALQQNDSAVATLYWRGVQVVGKPFWYLAHWNEWSLFRKR